MDSSIPSASEKEAAPVPNQHPQTHLLHIYKTGGAFNRDLIVLDSDKTTALYNIVNRLPNSFKNQRAGLEIYHAQSSPSTPNPPPIGIVTFYGLNHKDPVVEIHGRPVPFTRPDTIIVRYQYTWQSAIGPLTWRYEGVLGKTQILVTERDEWVAKYERKTGWTKRGSLEIVNVSSLFVNFSLPNPSFEMSLRLETALSYQDWKVY